MSWEDFRMDGLVMSAIGSATTQDASHKYEGFVWDSDLPKHGSFHPGTGGLASWGVYSSMRFNRSFRAPKMGVPHLFQRLGRLNFSKNSHSLGFRVSQT